MRPHQNELGIRRHSMGPNLEVEGCFQFPAASGILSRPGATGEHHGQVWSLQSELGGKVLQIRQCGRIVESIDDSDCAKNLRRDSS